MSKNIKLQKNKYKLGIITSSLAFILTSGLAIGLPAPDNYYFEGNEVENVQIENGIYKITFSDNEIETISRESLENNKDITYTGWTDITLPSGRKTPISARPDSVRLTIKMISSFAACLSFWSVYKNAQKYEKIKTK